MKHILIAAIILYSGVVQANDITNDQKQSFVEFYRDWSKLKDEFPNELEVKAIFVDIDGDENPEAFATSRGSTYETGSDWTAFRKVRGKWSPIPGIDPHSKKLRPVFAPFGREDEFYLIHETGNDTVVIHKDYDKLAPNGRAAAKVTRISLDDSGNLKSAPVASLDELIAYSNLFQMLRRLEAERFE